MRHGNLWASSVLHGCVVGTKCVSECTLYRPMAIQPLLHRAGPCTDCRTMDVLTRPTRVWKFKQVSEKVWRFAANFVSVRDTETGGHRDGLRHRNSVTESIENTLTRDFSLCWIQTVIVLNWKISANAQPAIRILFRHTF